MITRGQLKEVLEYDPDIGEFYWIDPGNRVDLVGKRAGYKHWKGYRGIEIAGQAYWEHRLAWLYVHGVLPEQLDHINRNRSDNRIANLRPATGEQNGGNAKARNGVSGLKGAHYSKRYGGKWSSKYRKDGRNIWLGYFKTAEEAHAAYCAAAKQQYGEFFHAG